MVENIWNINKVKETVEIFGSLKKMDKTFLYFHPPTLKMFQYKVYCIRAKIQMFWFLLDIQTTPV